VPRCVLFSTFLRQFPHYSAVALSLEANDFYDFSRDPFSLFYERHSQLRRAAAQVLILLSRKADPQQKEELTNLIHANKDLADNDRSYGSIEAYAREVDAGLMGRGFALFYYFPFQQGYCHRHKMGWSSGDPGVGRLLVQANRPHKCQEAAAAK
jgi:hypothetical protein